MIEIIKIEPHGVRLEMLNGVWTITNPALNDLYVSADNSQELWEYYLEYLRVLINEYCFIPREALSESGQRIRDYIDNLITWRVVREKK